MQDVRARQVAFVPVGPRVSLDVGDEGILVLIRDGRLAVPAGLPTCPSIETQVGRHRDAEVRRRFNCDSM